LLTQSPGGPLRAKNVEKENLDNPDKVFTGGPLRALVRAAGKRGRGAEDDIVSAVDRLLRLGQDMLAASAAPTALAVIGGSPQAIGLRALFGS
jgi:hypothetical protein